MAQSLPETPDIVNTAKHFTSMGLRVFPIRIQMIGGKWQKVPLTKHGHLDASLDVDVHDWFQANGCGIAMGDGTYAIDVDAHKDGAVDACINWIDRHHVNRMTRQHKTPSGGWHLIYRLPDGYERLRTRANVTTGLDTRGQGGWIAYGEGYRVIRDIEPALLSVAACKAFDQGGDASGPVVLKGYVPPDDPQALQRKWERAKVSRTSLLRARIRGSRLGLMDKSGSAMDHSVAKLLSMEGWKEDEIMWALLNAFEHGSASQKGKEHIAVRAAGRSAVKSVEATEREKDEIRGFKDAEDSDEIAAAMALVIKNARAFK